MRKTFLFLTTTMSKKFTHMSTKRRGKNNNGKDGKADSESIFANSIIEYIIWCNPTYFRIEEIDDKLYQLFFGSKKDLNRVINGSPWVFRNLWLLMVPWRRDVDPKDVVFKYVPVWMHLIGLLPHNVVR